MSRGVSWVWPAEFIGPLPFRLALNIIIKSENADIRPVVGKPLNGIRSEAMLEEIKIEWMRCVNFSQNEIVEKTVARLRTRPTPVIGDQAPHDVHRCLHE